MKRLRRDEIEPLIVSKTDADSRTRRALLGGLSGGLVLGVLGDRASSRAPSTTGYDPNVAVEFASLRGYNEGYAAAAKQEVELARQASREAVLVAAKLNQGKSVKARMFTGVIVAEQLGGVRSYTTNPLVFGGAESGELDTCWFGTQAPDGETVLFNLQRYDPMAQYVPSGKSPFIDVELYLDTSKLGPYMMAHDPSGQTSFASIPAMTVYEG